MPLVPIATISRCLLFDHHHDGKGALGDVVCMGAATGRHDSETAYWALPNISMGFAQLRAQLRAVSRPCCSAVQAMKIGDFGMSRFVGADEIMTALGPQHLSRNLTVDVIGTAHYASPELLNDEVPHPTTQLSAILDAHFYRREAP